MKNLTNKVVKTLFNMSDIKVENKITNFAWGEVKAPKILKNAK